MRNTLLTALVAATLTLTAAPAVSQQGLNAAPGTTLPDPTRTGTLTVNRVHGTNPAPDGVTVTVSRVVADQDGRPVDLTTNVGWIVASELDPDEADLWELSVVASVPTAGGSAEISGLPIGMFWVTMIYTDSGEVASVPFLAAIPTTNEAGDAWEYSVTAVPKAAWEQAAIGGVVWYDANRDGIFDSDESPLAGVRVHLFAVPGATPMAFSANSGASANAMTSEALAACDFDADSLEWVTTEITDAEGRWLVTGRPVQYKVVCFDVSGLDTYARVHSFTIPGFDSGVDPETGTVGPVSLTAWETHTMGAGVVSEAGVGQEPDPDEPPAEVDPSPDLPVTGATLAGLAVAGAAIGFGAILRVRGSRKRSGTEG